MAATSVPTAAGGVVSVRSGLWVGRESIPSGAWLARDCSRWHGAHEELCWGRQLNCPHLWIQLAQGRARPTQQTQLQSPQQR